MKHKRTPHNRYPARFVVGQLLILERFVPPILSGSPVTVADCHYLGRGEYRYQVTTAEYPARPVWVDESDLLAYLPQEA